MIVNLPETKSNKMRGFQFSLFLLLACTWQGYAQKPNVIVVLADDLGYETIGANGGTSYSTPEIDRLAANGIRFEHCYAQPLCTPSRVQIMTGIYNVRNYVRFGLLEENQVTFGHLFKEAGYQTCIVGKWQLGKDPMSPRRAGFDEHCLWQVSKGRIDESGRDTRFSEPVLETNGELKTHAKSDFGPKVVADYGIDFIERSARNDQPFFLYYPMILTHCPFSPTPGSPGWQTDTSAVMTYKGAAHYFGDMMAYTDYIIGRINRKLVELGIQDNTIILFTGDNGTDLPVVSDLSGRPVAGAKGQSTDAGTRVPLILQWPKQIPIGQVNQDLIDLTDVLPTMCAAAGIDVPDSLQIDGRSFLPQLKGEKGNPRDWIYSWYARSGSVAEARVFARNQRFKLYDTGEFYEIPKDYDEENPLEYTTLDLDTKNVHNMLKNVLDDYAQKRLEDVPLSRASEPIGMAQLSNPAAAPRAMTTHGLVEGTHHSGVSAFRGIPFAQPPVGDLRWKEPQPVKPWEGIRMADHFGPRAMQRPIFDDMNFRSNGMSEDCLYLNVWTPAKTGKEKLPVLIYFYGGGLFTGDGSEFRYDGESMARKGIVTLTVNYRLNVFGFMAHPELSAESPHHGSGNYGFLDQLAALEWVRDNIAAFGGDPDRVTIAGESAGSVSVSAQMASPLSKDLIAGAIGSSASILGTLGVNSLSDGEQLGLKFAESIGKNSLVELRAMSAEAILAATTKFGLTDFSPIVDGHFFPQAPVAIFTAGEQAQVPLLLGWNSMESGYQGVIGSKEPTVENYKKALNRLYPKHAEAVFNNYPARTKEEVVRAAIDLASDRFTGYSTWKWADLHRQTSNQAIYQYFYTHPRPALEGQATPLGAVHSAEIEYAMGNLPTNKVYPWTAEDFLVSSLLQNYYANFVKTGNPNGLGLPQWSKLKEAGKDKILQIGAQTYQKQEEDRERYIFLDQFYNN